MPRNLFNSLVGNKNSRRNLEVVEMRLDNMGVDEMESRRRANKPATWTGDLYTCM